MPELPPSTRLVNAVKTTAALPQSLIKYLASEPLLTGPLLYLLTRGPQQYREKLLAPLRTNLLAKNGAERLSRIITALKVLFAVGVVDRFNRAMNTLALNNWKLPGLDKRAKWVWDGKTEVVVITGGCSGFGYEMVKEFAGKARIVVIDVAPFPKELEELPEVNYYNCDLTDFSAITSTTTAIKNRHGSPTVLINNAGIGLGATILATPVEFIENIMKVNLASHFVLIKEFLPGMLEAKKGHVVGVSSMAAFVSMPGLVDYCVTKVGVLALHEGLRNELLTRYENGHCIANSTVHPSWHSTGILKGREAELAKHGITADPPSNVARAVVDQVLKHKSGRIYMPRSEEGKIGLRQQPLWLQDWFVGVFSVNPFKKGSKAFGFDQVFEA